MGRIDSAPRVSTTEQRPRPSAVPPKAPGVAAWWQPDLALFVSIVTLFYCLILFDGGRKLFRDADSGWHIRTGERIIDERALPRVDPFSFTRAGEPWFAWEWGADVLMGAAHRVDGLRGVAFFYAVAIAACTWLWFQLVWQAGGNFFFACALASLMLSTANLHWLARPHVLSWLLLLVAVWWAETMPGRFTARHGLIAAAAAALWANLHASFMLAPAVALLYAAAHAVRPLIWDLDAATEFRRARVFSAVAGCALLGTMANPYGWNLHAHVVAYLANTELLSRIGEFQSFNFNSEGTTQIVLAIGVAAAGGVLALGQQKLAHFLLALAFLFLALRSARGLPLVALVVLPLACGAITQALSNWRRARPQVRRWLDAFFAYSDRLRDLDAGLHGLALVPLVLLLAFSYLRMPAVSAGIGFPADQFPVAAAKQLEALPAQARLLAPDKFGGYIIYRLAGRRPVFFDGRSDFYGLDFMKDYIRLVEVRPGWQQQLERHRFTHALLPNTYSLIPALEQLGWRPIYRDHVATLLEKQP